MQRPFGVDDDGNLLTYLMDTTKLPWIQW